MIEWLASVIGPALPVVSILLLWWIAGAHSNWKEGDE